ncbi:VOC family protein [Thalassotalea fusca]
MTKGLNHITLSVTNLYVSLDFYVNVLKFKPICKWRKGAYLQTNGIWLCLAVGEAKPSQDYSHIAFTLTQHELDEVSALIQTINLPLWQENTSEGDSLYLLDPDQHKLELHVGDLSTRLRSLVETPYEGLEWFE